MIITSFTDPSLGLENYKRFFATPSALHSLWVTVSISVTVTGICAVIGYIYTYMTILARPLVGRTLLAIVLLPAGMNILVRTFALEVILADQGVINKLLRYLHITSSPVALARTPFAIGLGMVSMLLPFMVFPLYTIMRRIDPELITAAKSLGAVPRVAFWRVFFPLSLPGLSAGALIVFVSALGYFVVPQLLGNNGSDRFLSQYTSLYIADGEWGYGAAIGVVLLVMTLGTLALAARAVRIGDALRSSVGDQR